MGDFSQDTVDPLSSSGILTTLKQQIDDSLEALQKMPNLYEYDHKNLKEFSKGHKKSMEKLMDTYRILDTQYRAFKKQYMYYPEDPDNK